MSMNEAARERLALLKGKKEDQKVRKSTVSYRSANILPREPEISELKIYVGKLWIPLSEVRVWPPYNYQNYIWRIGTQIVI